MNLCKSARPYRIWCRQLPVAWCRHRGGYGGTRWRWIINLMNLNGLSDHLTVFVLGAADPFGDSGVSAISGHPWLAADAELPKLECGASLLPRRRTPARCSTPQPADLELIQVRALLGVKSRRYLTRLQLREYCPEQLFGPSPACADNAEVAKCIRYCSFIGFIIESRR